MQKPLSTYWHNFRYLADRIGVICAALERQAELEQLTEWAKCKRLARPLKLYQSRLQDEEQRLTTYGIRHPKLLTFCQWVRAFAQQAKGTQVYYAKGAATKYRLAQG